MLRLTSADRAIYLQAVAELRPLHVPLNVAVLEYASAVRQLPKGATLKEAVDFFQRRSPANLEPRTVRQVVDEMLAAKRAANLSKVHLSDLESRLGRFAGAFQMTIGGVSGKLHELRRQLPERDTLLMALGAAQQEAGRSYTLLKITVLASDQAVTL